MCVDVDALFVLEVEEMNNVDGVWSIMLCFVREKYIKPEKIKFAPK
jgi:hypothetical protein